MALGRMKTEMGHARGANDRWALRAVAKDVANVWRRRADRSEAQDQDPDGDDAEVMPDGR